MAPQNGFGEYVVELLGPLGDVRLRTMFGGFGLFLDGVMFALIASDTLYLKVDAETQSAFEAAGSEAFRFESKGRTVSMSYFEAPVDALEDTESLMPWAEMAVAASRRGKASTQSRPRKRS